MLTFTMVLRCTTPKGLQLLKFCAVRLKKTLKIIVVLRDRTPDCLQLFWFCVIRLQKCLQLLRFYVIRLQNAGNYFGFARYDSKFFTITVVLRGTTPKRLRFLMFLNDTTRFVDIPVVLHMFFSND